jgi:hypothetical protein
VSRRAPYSGTGGAVETGGASVRDAYVTEGGVKNLEYRLVHLTDHNRDGSLKTQADRRRMLRLCRETCGCALARA